MFQPNCVANTKTTLIVIIFVGGEEVSLKFSPTYCVQPFATNLSLKLYLES